MTASGAEQEARAVTGPKPILRVQRGRSNRALQRRLRLRHLASNGHGCRFRLRPFPEVTVTFSAGTIYRRRCGGSRIGQRGWIRTTDPLLPRQVGTAGLPYTLMIGARDRSRTCIVQIRNLVLLQLSYASNWYAVRDSNPRTQLERLRSWPLDERRVKWLPSLASNQASPVNSRQPSPRWLDGNEMVETVGNAPTATILQGSSAPLCCPRGAEGWFRSNLPAFSARCFHQISFLGKLVRTLGIEPRPSEWRSDTRPSSYIRKWWAETESNRHRLCGAFTAPWARQCPVCP
jgi:hypothetical protein